MVETTVQEPRLSQVRAVSQDKSDTENYEDHEADKDGRSRLRSPSRRDELDLWARRLGAVIVAAVAAYASYQHQREFALHGGADVTSAGLWPLSVDGLLVLATAGLLKSEQTTSRRARYAMRLTFAVGIAVSLAANIASAPASAGNRSWSQAGHQWLSCWLSSCWHTAGPSFQQSRALPISWMTPAQSPRQGARTRP